MRFNTITAAIFALVATGTSVFGAPVVDAYSKGDTLVARDDNQGLDARDTVETSALYARGFGSQEYALPCSQC